MTKADSQTIGESISSECLASLEMVELNLEQNTLLIFLTCKA